VNAYDANYYKYQTDSAKTAINPSTPNVDLMNYVRSPSEIFNGGNWRGFNAFFTNPANNPAGYSLMAKDVYQTQVAQEQRKADVQAVAYQGFKATVGADGVTVKTPGITIGQLVDKVQGFSLDSISSAQGVGAIIQSMATTVINAVVTKGLNTANEVIAQNTGVNLGLNTSSLANIDWNNSGSGQSAEFNNGMNNFNTDVQSGLSSGSQEWGNMNFASGNTNTTSASGQDSFSSLDSFNFQSQQTTTPVNSGTSTFIPDTTWSAPTTPQSKDPLWVPQSGN